MLQTPTPPFRADHVGSLLRPPSIVEARARYAQGRIDAAELKAAEDAAIPALIKMQEDVGLKAVTDGEARRSWWHYDFIAGLDGFELEERSADQGVQFQGIKLRPVSPTIRGKLGFPADHPMLDHFRFVADHTGVVPKISIPGPSCCHFRTEPEDIAPEEYRDLDHLFADIAATYRDAVRAFYDAGCRYLQMDDIFFAYLCDEKHREAKRAQGQDPDWLIDRYAWMMHEAIRGPPRRHADRDAHVPGELPLDLRGGGGVRPGGGRDLQQDRRRHLLHGVRHGAGRRTSSRSGCSPGAASASCRGSSQRRRANWRTWRGSSASSTRRRNTPISTSLASRRNAASPQPKRATPSPKTTSAASWSSWFGLQRRSGVPSELYQHTSCAS